MEDKNYWSTLEAFVFLLDNKTNIKLDGMDDVGTQHLKKWYLVNMRIV